MSEKKIYVPDFLKKEIEKTNMSISVVKPDKKSEKKLDLSRDFPNKLKVCGQTPFNSPNNSYLDIVKKNISTETSKETKAKTCDNYTNYLVLSSNSSISNNNSKKTICNDDSSNNNYDNDLEEDDDYMEEYEY